MSAPYDMKIWAIIIQNLIYKTDIIIILAFVSKETDPKCFQIHNSST